MASSARVSRLSVSCEYVNMYAFLPTLQQNVKQI